MPPIIEDYAAIKSRMEELAKSDVQADIERYNRYLESILSDEGRAFIEKHKHQGDL